MVRSGDVTLSSVASRRPRTVLVVDDYPSTLESISRLLQAANHRVCEASSGEDAVRVAIREEPHIALIDYRLPGIDGLETASAIRKAGLEIPWVLFSGHVNDRLAFEAARMGAVNVVWSPFDPRTVIRDAFNESEARTVSDWDRLLGARQLKEPGTTAGLAAWWILVACASKNDLATIQVWSNYLGVSYTSLRDAIKRLGIDRMDARAFVRILRALVHVRGRVEHIEAELALADPRSSDAILEQSGLARDGEAEIVTVESFLARQRFIPADHPLLHALRALLAQL